MHNQSNYFNYCQLLFKLTSYVYLIIDYY